MSLQPLDVVPILQRISAHAAAGIATAIVEDSPKGPRVVVSYGDLLTNVKEVSIVVARLLAVRAEGAPRHVAYLVNPGICYVVTELSVWGAGACCVPLSVHSPAPELEYFLTDAEVPLGIADDSMTGKLGSVTAKLDRAFATIRLVPGEGAPRFQLDVQDGVKMGEPEMTASVDDSALILYTSGTTGKPKGVVHTFGSLTAQNESLSEAWKWSSKDYTLHVLPLHHIHGVQNILNTALFNGAAVEFVPFDPAFCLKRLCSGDITCFHAVPTIYVKFTQFLEKLDETGQAEIRAGLRNEFLRYMVSGSAALPVPTMKSWAEISGHVLLERYGMTEIGMGLSNRVDATRYPGCVGWALPQVQVKLAVDGGILIKGATLFKEYYKREASTKESFTEDGWFITGDNAQCGGDAETLQAFQNAALDVEAATGRPDPQSTDGPDPVLSTIYKIMGRTSVDIIKSGGDKISALEIESVLLQHDLIRECAVVGKPDETWGEKVTAVCVLKGDLSLEELRKWGKERMATYKVPQELDVVAELPRNQMGKLEKKKILDQWKQ